MIEESEKSPMVVLAVIIVSLLAYNILSIRDKHNETKNVRISYNDMQSIADGSEQSAEEYASGGKFVHVVKDAGTWRSDNN